MDAARTEDRSLLRTWAMRGTVHILATEDAMLLVPLFEPAFVANSRRRLGQLGMEPAAQDRALREIERALGSDGALSRSELSERLARKGIELNTQTRLHVFRLAVGSGIACLGPDRGAQSLLVLEHDWLGPRTRFDRKRSLAELARRYLRAFGPATEADFAGWAGLPLRDVRAGLEAIAATLVPARVGDAEGWALRGRGRRFGDGTVRLLPAWDTYLMGYRERGFLAAPDEWRRIAPGGGMLDPTVTVDGRAVATWRLRRARSGHDVEVRAFGGLGSSVRSAIEAEAADVARFEGAAQGELTVIEPSSR